MKLGYNPVEINPVDGDLTIGGNINTDGNYIDVYGTNSNQLIIDGVISGTGGLSLKQNSNVVFTNSNMTYTGATTLENGVMELGVELASAITVQSGATLKIVANSKVAALTINSGGVVEIQYGKGLTITGNLVNNGTLTVQSDATGTGSLIVNGTAAGNITSQRYIPANNYHYISAPVNTGTTKMKDIQNTASADYMGLVSTVNYNSFWEWDEDDDLWRDLLHGGTPLMDSREMEAARGYIYSDMATSAGGGDNNTVAFVGVPRVADVTYTTTYTNPGGHGYHLVGNPFSSNIAVNFGTDYLLNSHGMLEIYVWKDASTDYTTYNDASTDMSLQPGQAFMIKVASAGTITFDKDIRNHGSASFYKSNGEVNRLYLNVVSESGEANQALVAFAEGKTDGYDISFDSEKIKGNPQIALYSKMVDGTAGDWAIQTLSAESVASAKVNICLDARTDLNVENKPEAYTFSIANPEMFTGEVFIEDLENGSFHNLLESPYIVKVEQGFITDRFYLHFRDEDGKAVTGLSNSEIVDYEVYSSNNNIYLKNVSGEVSVFDLSGRLVQKVEAQNETTTISGLNSGAYIVKTVLGSKKVVL